MYGNPYGYPFMPQQPMIQQQIIKVNGRPGAQALNMGPNASALALDETAPIVWLCRTDGAGYKTVIPYNISEYKQDPEPDLSDISKRLKRLEDLYEESHTGRVRGAGAATKQNKSNVSSISGGGKSGRVSAGDDSEEPDPFSDRE